MSSFVLSSQLFPLKPLKRYNSAMLGLTLWAVNLFQANHHLLGAVAFVMSLGFKQMSLYYSPAMLVFPSARIS